MKLSTTAILLATIQAAGAFTPSLPSQAIGNVVKDAQRFHPLNADFDDDFEDDDDAPPETMIELDGMEDVEVVVADSEVSDWYAFATRVKESREKYRLHDKDTGSPEYQVAGMTERISYLTAHLQQHPKDYSTRRGLVALVNKRRRLLNYLFKEDIDRYQALVSSLGVRHKAPGAVPSRAEQYSRFPKQKALKKHLLKKK